MKEEELGLRNQALERRLRLEEFAFQWFAIAAPYVNEEDKIGWKAADVIKFLRAEIDPNFLQGRKLSVSAQVPDSENPTAEDYEELDWSPLTSEQDLNIKKFTSLWSSMGQLLHIDPLKPFDSEKAERQIASVDKFCETLSVSTFVTNVHLLEVEMTCSDGHRTKRNAARFKPGQIIPCMNHQCGSVFSINDTMPVSWQEVKLAVTCGKCGIASSYPPKQLVKLSYWEKAAVPCLNEECDHHTEVQWVLSKKLDI